MNDTSSIALATEDVCFSIHVMQVALCRVREGSLMRWVTSGRICSGPYQCFTAAASQWARLRCT